MSRDTIGYSDTCLTLRTFQDYLWQSTAIQASGNRSSIKTPVDGVAKIYTNNPQKHGKAGVKIQRANCPDTLQHPNAALLSPGPIAILHNNVNIPTVCFTPLGKEYSFHWLALQSKLREAETIPDVIDISLDDDDREPVERVSTTCGSVFPTLTKSPNTVLQQGTKERQTTETTSTKHIKKQRKSFARRFHSFMEADLTQPNGSVPLVPLPHQDEYKIRLNVTPQPNFGAMTSPQLERETFKYGLQQMKRSVAVKSLEWMYDQLHPTLALMKTKEH